MDQQKQHKDFHELVAASLLNTRILGWMNKGLDKADILDLSPSETISDCIGAVMYAWRKDKPEPPPPGTSIRLIKTLNLLMGLESWLKKNEKYPEGLCAEAMTKRHAGKEFIPLIGTVVKCIKQLHTGLAECEKISYKTLMLVTDALTYLEYALDDYTMFDAEGGPENAQAVDGQLSL